MDVLSDIFVFYAIHLEHLHSWRVGLELLSGAEIAEIFDQHSGGQAAEHGRRARSAL